MQECSWKGLFALVVAQSHDGGSRQLGFVRSFEMKVEFVRKAKKVSYMISMRTVFGMFCVRLFGYYDP